jgi:hypothetical protein
MCVSWRSAADQAGVAGQEFAVVLVAPANGFGDHADAVGAGRFWISH